MIGLVLKDFYNMKKSYLAVIGVLIFLSVMAIIQGESISECIPTILVLIPTIVISNTFEFDNRSKWENYAMTMPITRKEIIKGKYLTLIISIVGITAITTIVNIVVGVLNGGVLLNQLTKDICFCISIGIIMCSIMIPIICKFGLEKMRIVYIVLMFVTTFFMTQLTTNPFFMVIQNKLEWLNNYVEIIALIFAILMCFISYLISVRIYGKKEF